MVIGEDFFVLHGGVSVGEGYVGVAVWDEGFFNKSMAAGARKLEDSRIVNLLLTGPFLQAPGLLRPDFPRKCVASPFRNEILWVV